MRVVIAGAGTAGCVLAARLTEDPATEVVLLEAGPHYRRDAWPAELAHSHRVIRETHDWGFLAQAGASPRLVHVPRGRVVGGSSITNGAVALRGLPAHYDEWDEHVDGFGWQTWLPWFRAIERDLPFPSVPWHATAGRSRSTGTRARSGFPSWTGSPRRPWPAARSGSTTTTTRPRRVSARPRST